MAGSRPQLRVYGRSYCSLCADMMTALRALQPGLDFDLEWVDVEDADELESRYGARVPVLVGEDGRELCQVLLDRPQLDAYLRQMR